MGQVLCDHSHYMVLFSKLLWRCTVYRGAVERLYWYYIVFLLTAFINLINTLSRSSRLVGVRTGQLAAAITLFSIVYLASSFANTLQAPLLATTVDTAIIKAEQRSLEAEPEAVVTETAVYQAALTELNGKLRFVLLGASVGSLLGILLIPSFVTSYANAVKLFGQTGSTFRVILLIFLSLFKPGSGILKLRLPSLGTLKSVLSRKMVTPVSFLVWNLISYSMWTVNILAGLYGEALLPDFRTIPVAAAAVVGNAAIVLNVMMVDPVLAKVTDAVAAGEQDEMELKQIIFYLSFTNLCGTLFAQVIFEPVTQGLLIIGRWLV